MDYLKSFRNRILNNTRETLNVTNIVGPIWTIKELKSIFAAEPIIILGGSPIRVAAPPTLDAST
jgi:hypothetical protein